MPQINVTKILDGQRNAVFHVFVEGSGLGDVTDEVLIDPAVDFDPAGPSSPSLTLESISYDLTGFSAKLEFDYLASDTPVWSMSEGPGGYADFCKFGGLKDRSLGDGLGKLKMTTNGLGNGDWGVVVLSLRKD